MKYKINQADILDWAKNYNGEPFDGILCDPPYELGFMGKSWDSTGIAFNVELWTELLRIIKPGGHLLAFSGSRTYHRMAVAIEDAGFEIRDMIEWVYGSGFPKSLNIGKAVDKIQGNEVIKESFKPTTQQSSVRYGKCEICGKPKFSGNPCVCPKPKSNNEWEGYGTALKPAHEPCVLARKPLEGTVAQNCLKHGTGGLNIDGTRIGTTENTGRPSGANPGMWAGKKQMHSEAHSMGRFPANLIHDGSDEVEAVFPSSKGGGFPKTNTNGSSMFGTAGIDKEERVNMNDSGSAARFFYTAKASKSERNAGLEGFEEKTNKFGNQKNGEDIGNGSLNDKFTNKPSANYHPTVKPLSLTKYLATLIKPPTGGRLLVPFSGSGSEMIGALQAGWEYVEGVELTEEYIPIAEARIAHWVKIPQQETLI